jgi:hypothetical protein
VAEPVDLEGHTRRIQGRVLHLPEPLADVARDYVSFLTALAQHRALLERHCFVVLADSSGETSSLWGQCKGALRRLRARARRRGVGSEQPDVITTEVARRLTARCDLVGRHLARSGLRTHRLDSRELAELLRRCWSPDLARVQRLRDELGAYTSLFVSADQAVPRAWSTRPASWLGGIDDEKLACQAESEDDDRLLTLGTRTLADLIAPDSFEVRADHLRLANQYDRVLAITGYPRLVTAGWLSVLVESDLPIEVSVHVRPLASADMVRALSHQVARLQSSRLAQLRGKRVADPEREIALEDAERLRERTNSSRRWRSSVNSTTATARFGSGHAGVRERGRSPGRPHSPPEDVRRSPAAGSGGGTRDRSRDRLASRRGVCPECRCQRLHRYGRLRPRRRNGVRCAVSCRRDRASRMDRPGRMYRGDAVSRTTVAVGGSMHCDRAVAAVAETASLYWTRFSAALAALVCVGLGDRARAASLMDGLVDLTGWPRTWAERVLCYALGGGHSLARIAPRR